MELIGSKAAAGSVQCELCANRTVIAIKNIIVIFKRRQI